MLNSLYVGIYMDVMLARKSILELLRMVWHHFAMLVVERKSIHAFGVASFSGHSQILSRSCGENSGEGLGSLLRHGPEMVDSVMTYQVYILIESTISGP